MALALLPEAQRPQVRHQSGRDKLEGLQRHYEEAGVEAECSEFIDDMAAAYSEADLVVCRSGALTVAELAAAGVGALLVPYPYAVDNHQTANARFVASGEAGLLLPQSELTAAKLASVLEDLDRDVCRRWAENARRMAKPDSAGRVAEAALAAVGIGTV